MKKIVLLGASGSIGLQTIDVIKSHLDEFQLIAFSVGKQLDVAQKLCREFSSLEFICIASEEDAVILRSEFTHLNIVSGDKGLITLAKIQNYDIFVNAVVGFRGLQPTLAAIENKKTIALANKESLVTGGPLVRKALQENEVELIPIDSEHSAILQCLQGNQHQEIERLIVTASGGSFRDKTRNELVGVTKEQALKHPNWNMGGRITIDSATMMNKGFEVIEAHYLFDIPFDKIDVILHKESAIHSMVQYCDHSIIAQIGTPDMRLPIQYALSFPHRLEMKNAEQFNFLNYPTLHFEKPSYDRFPLLKLAYEVGKKGGNLGAIMNGADEEAVALFLNDEISFLDIETYIISAIDSLPFIQDPSLEEIIESDRLAREFVRNKVK